MGPSGELIIDYSIYDAVRAGFDRVVLIIRRDIYDDFRAAIGERLERCLRPLGVELVYGFQDMDGLPAGRNKPWGTGQALLSCRELLTGPFAVINADDYYGRHAFRQAYEFLSAYDPARPNQYGMIGFLLKNTLSDAGGVTRGLCTVDDSGHLAGIRETRGIIKTPQGAAVKTDSGLAALDGDQLVSMNMWMLTPAFLEELRTGFAAFRASIRDPLSDEYLLPEILDRHIRKGRAKVRVLPTQDEWFGMTYQEDRAAVMESVRRLIADGTYSEDLFADLSC